MKLPSVVTNLKVRSWLFSGVVALVLTVLVLLDKGAVSAESNLSAPCRVEVTADVLNVRNAPDPGAETVATVHRGDLRGAQPTVRNGYRELADGNWALDEFLRPLPGSQCTEQ